MTRSLRPGAFANMKRCFLLHSFFIGKFTAQNAQMSRSRDLLIRLLCVAAVSSAFSFAQIHPSVSLTASPSPAGLGQPVTLTAAVTPGATGLVTFFDGTTILGVGGVSGTQQATLTTVMLPAGVRSLRAYYGGDSTYLAASSVSVPETVAAGASLGFRKPVTTGTPASGVGLATGDFNGDGKLDFVTTNSSSQLLVYLGNGDGTFRTGVAYSTPVSSYAVAIGDFNGDGKLDLVVASSSVTIVGVLLGNGDGTFQAVVNYPTSLPHLAVAVADFNADGKADLVGPVGAVRAPLPFCLETAMAATTHRPGTSVGNSVYSLVIQSLNGDGNADVIARYLRRRERPAGQQARLLRCSGKLPAQYLQHDRRAAGRPRTAMANWTSSSRPATITAASSFSRATATGTFGTAVNYSTNNSTYRAAIADADGDGKLDALPGELVRRVRSVWRRRWNFEACAIDLLLGDRSDRGRRLQWRFQDRPGHAAL